MKLFARPKYFADTTAPLVTAVPFLGLRAFEFRGRPRYIISFIYLLLLYVLYCCSLHVRLAFKSKVNILKLESMLSKLMLSITSASILMKLLLGWWYTEKYKDCHQKLTAIEKTLRQLGLTVKYDKIYFTMVGLMAVWLVPFWCGWTAVHIFLNDFTGPLSVVFSVLSYSYGVCIDSIIVLEFFVIVKCIKMKFELINRHLWENLGTSISTRDTKLGVFETDDYACIVNYDRRRDTLAGNILTCQFYTPKSRIIFVIEKQKSLKTRVQANLQSREESSSGNQQQKDCFLQLERRKCLVQTIKQVHLELCKISKTVCNIFGVQIAWEIGMCIMVLTRLSYTIYIRYVAKQNKLPNHFPEQIISIIMLSILNVSKLILVTRACKTTADEGNKTIEIIRATYGYDADAELTDEIQQFSLQVLQNPVAFIVFGLSLDNAVLTMSLRFITTYLVIMIQVSNSLESNKTIPHAHL